MINGTVYHVGAPAVWPGKVAMILPSEPGTSSLQWSPGRVAGERRDEWAEEDGVK